MAKQKIETIETGMAISQKEIDELGVGDQKTFEFECNENKDPNFEYRWCELTKASYFKMKKYTVSDEAECKRIKPFFGEWKDGAWHLEPGHGDHYILMRCPKVLFNRRREFYGAAGRDAMLREKERLKDAGRQQWKRGDTIKPDDIITDERMV